MNRTLLADERGISSTEYVILLVLVVVAGMFAWERLGKDVNHEVRETQDYIIKRR